LVGGLGPDKGFGGRRVRTGFIEQFVEAEVASVICTRRTTSVLFRGTRVKGESGRPSAMQFLVLISDAERAVIY
jgi:hypothetical protein